SSMTAAAGLRDADPQAAYRRDVCHFADDRLSPVQKIRFVHELLHREMAEVRMFLGYIEKHSASLGVGERLDAPVSQALDDTARDQDTRRRYLEFARDADEPAVRARMIKLAHALGWLSRDEVRVDLVQIMHDRMAR